MIDDRSIQRFLAAKGAYTGAIDGDFGPKSKKAAKDTLRDSGISTNGWSDARRKIAIQQMMMTEAGIEAGPIDGLPGPQTEYAWEQWQNHVRSLEPAAGDVDHQPTRWPRQKDVPVFYGAVGRNQKRLRLPFKMKLAWDTSKEISSFSVHEKVHASAKRAFDAILAHYGKTKIKQLGLDLYGGCLNVRKMRGGSRYSMHSWGIAIDFDPAHNRLRWGRDRARMAKREYAPFLDAWEAEGWISLGRERNFDWMHVQAARL